MKCFMAQRDQKALGVFWHVLNCLWPAIGNLNAAIWLFTYQSAKVEDLADVDRLDHLLDVWACQIEWSMIHMSDSEHVHVRLVNMSMLHGKI